MEGLVCPHLTKKNWTRRSIRARFWRRTRHSRMSAAPRNATHRDCCPSSIPSPPLATPPRTPPSRFFLSSRFSGAFLCFTRRLGYEIWRAHGKSPLVQCAYAYGTSPFGGICPVSLSQNMRMIARRPRSPLSVSAPQSTGENARTDPSTTPIISRIAKRKHTKMT
ncbi:hypothetical protein BC826DRAFT_556473 [Russula brevipes]|nr:hypothetical protein BC826DRAFT_556473 [Russula brevipes]